MVQTPTGVGRSLPSDLPAEVARYKYRYSEEILKETEERLKMGAATQAEYDQARFGRDIAEAEFSQDPVRVKQLKFELAENLLGIEARYNSGETTLEEFAHGKVEKDVAEAELNDKPLEARRIKVEAADADLKLVESKRKIGKATQTEYLRAKLARDIAAAEYSQQMKMK